MKKIYECVVCGGTTTDVYVERNKNGEKIKRPICTNCWRVIKNNKAKKAEIFKGE